MLIILIIIVCVYLKIKIDEKEKQKAIYYKEQQARITLYLKHNTKEPNTIKSVHFTNLETSPMGSAVIEGYINENKKDNFTAYATPEHNYQFGGAMIKSEGVDKLLKPAHERKSPDDIKKELNKK
ncbi:DUF1433 domain-containing protein [Staphylococcus aureus]|nr:DUF1433 domain-containing protein [Staphylococcus aureus]EMB4601413.1 DUF1433 domain-containing protein [Staphylococcus aureus]HDK8055845.1 DUF1433 domain-containing protein [Staphylococcus aureus]